MKTVQVPASCNCCGADQAFSGNRSANVTWYTMPASILKMITSEAGCWRAALRCAACHESDRGSLAMKPLAAPDLVSLQGNLDRDWLISWLVEPAQPSKTAEELVDDEVQRRMPHLGLDRQSASDIAAALMDASKKPDAIRCLAITNPRTIKPRAKIKRRPGRHLTLRKDAR